jgi:cyclic dehypoxanthinyl futalosine synthase
MRKADPARVSFVVDRNINYTNVCVTDCSFCNFYRPVGHAEGYVLKEEILLGKIQELVDAGGTQVLLQGGHNPHLKLDYYLGLLKTIKAAFPNITLHAFSPSEIAFLSKLMKTSIAEALRRLREAGLDSIPGGGGEILDDEIRALISPKKLDSAGWLEVMRQAHLQGLKTSATMMWGDYCRPEHLVRHMIKIRDLQAETGGFIAFIPWTFQAEGTELGRQFPQKPVTAYEYLRVLAVSRLVIPNVPNLQVSWVTQGPKVAQVALHYGGNDFGGTMMEENVVSAAGSVHARLDRETVIALIQGAGFQAFQRNTFYEAVRAF